MTTERRESLVAYAPLAESRRAEVSVLVPAKDEADNLPLFMQLAAEAFATHPQTPYEVVVVDDGSTDGTPAAVQRIADPRLRVVVQPANRGVAAARNAGLEVARGHWLAFLDDDTRRQQKVGPASSEKTR